MAEQSLIKQYSLLACIQCGRCTGGCPVSLSSQLNIRLLIYQILIGRAPSLEAELWDCTTCSTCKSRCPKGIAPVDMIVGIRGELVERGKVQPTVRDVLEAVFKHGNPWGRARAKRAEWAKDLDVRGVREGAGVLYYVGCAASYDPRVQEVAKALVRLFKEADVDFGILGEEENCCGNEVRRMGEEGLFEMLVEDNLETLKKCPAERVVTTSPHCYNAFKNEYDGLELEVEHYTQYLWRLIEEGRLNLSRRISKTVTYQDPCFLGKQNAVFDEPRSILNSIPGIQYIELDRARERSLCCEGGGGRMWVEASYTGERLAERRVKDALDMGAQILATACPFCLLTLEDAVKTTGSEEKIEVKDIAELVVEAI